MFQDEAKAIKLILRENCIQIDHTGSTSIPGIYAKPIIDILVTVTDLKTADSLNPEFESRGYTCMGEYGIEGRRFYWKTPAKRTHHIHLFQEGSPEIKKHLRFRNCMRSHTGYAQAYSTLKRTLSLIFPHDIEHYLNGKAPLIEAVMNGNKPNTPVNISLEAPEGCEEEHWVALLEGLGYALYTSKEK